MVLADRKVVVVGGASGIGRAVAEMAAAEAARVTIIGRTAARLEEAAHAIGRGVATIVADARDLDSLRAAFGAIGRIDHLVTSISVSAASLGVQTTLAEMPPAGARSFFEGKFWGQLQAAQTALPHLAEAGSITFTSGVASRKGLPHHTVIAATNAAVDTMAKQLAREVAPRRVNVVSPGLTDTRAYDHLPPERKAAFFAHVTGQLPVGRVARPEDVAQAYRFAMTADYVTGTVIDIDGGLLVH